MTPTPDTTARTETAETVTVPREALQTMRMRAAGLSNALYNLANGNLTGVYRQQSLDLVKEWDAANSDFNAALASPQHPVGVREALEEAIGCFAAAEAEGMSDRLAEAREADGFDTGSVAGLFERRIAFALPALERALAALSHPPAQDAPGAVKVKVKALVWEEQFARRSVEDPSEEVIGFSAATPFRTFYEIDVGAAMFTIDHDHTTIGQFEDEADAKAAAQADHDRRILAALDPSPPLPEADGEVVAWRYEAEIDAGRWGSFVDSCKPIGPGVRNVEPFVRQSALVSALRERDKADRKTEEACKRLAHNAEVKGDLRALLTASEAAREKAEQVADGLRAIVKRGYEGWSNVVELRLLPPQHVRSAEELRDLFWEALRASTEEGKTGTPSVAEGKVAKTPTDANDAMLAEIAAIIEPKGDAEGTFSGSILEAVMEVQRERDTHREALHMIRRLGPQWIGEIADQALSGWSKEEAAAALSVKDKEAGR